MGFYRIVFALLLCGVATVTTAQPYRLVVAEQPVMIELFTSEGCSSCPPAEARLNDFTRNDQLWHKFIPLAFHVDYWDYLGWKDPYANPDHSHRQRTYSSRGRLSTVYTPAFVVNGKEWRPGWFGRKAPTSDATIAPLDVAIEDGSLRTQIPSSARPLVLNVALLGMGLQTDIEAGENRGRHSEHEFVVLNWQRREVADGLQQMSVPQPGGVAAQRYALVVWLSDRRDPAPLYAAGGYLPDEMVGRLGARR